MKVAIIGAGNIGGAIAKGLIKSQKVSASDITCTTLTQETLDRLKAANAEINTTLNNVEAVKDADIIMHNHLADKRFVSPNN